MVEENGKGQFLVTIAQVISRQREWKKAKPQTEELFLENYIRAYTCLNRCTDITSITLKTI